MTSVGVPHAHSFSTKNCWWSHMTSLLPDAVAIGVGAVFGAYSRFHIGRLATEKIAQDPKRFGVYSGWHTAGINIAGSFILGIVSQAPVSKSTNIPGLTHRTKLMLGVGFCGSFTTFSTFSCDVVSWIAKGETIRAMQYVMVNNVGSVMGAAAGMAFVKKILS